MGRRVKKPDIFKTAPKEKVRTSKYLHRLKVVAEVRFDGSYGMTRAVFIQRLPKGLPIWSDRWEDFPLHFEMTVADVADFIWWAKAALPLDTVYEPAGNMAGYICPKKREDEQYLFDNNG